MSRHTIRIVLLTAILIVSFLPQAFALYSWVDKNGVFHITDAPPPGARPQEQPKEEAPAARPAEPAPAVSEPVEKSATPAPAQAPAQKQSTTSAPVAPAPSKPTPAAPASKAATPPASAAMPAAAPAPAVPAKNAPAAQAAKPATPGQTAATPPASPSPAAPAAAPSKPAAAPSPPPPAQASQPEQPMKNEEPAPARETSQPPHKVPPAAVLATLIAAFMGVFLFALVAAYVYFSLCLYLIAKKLHPDNAWMAWVPIVQMASFVESAGKPLFWIIFLFIPLVNIIVITYLWMCIAENLGRNRLLGLLTLVPIANLIVMGMFAFSKQEGGSEPAPEHAEASEPTE